MDDNDAAIGLNTLIDISSGSGRVDDVDVVGIMRVEDCEMARGHDSLKCIPHYDWISVTSTVIQHDFGFELLQQTNEELLQQITIQTVLLQTSQTQLIQSRQLSEQLRETLEADRTRISREIHDQLGELLTGLKFDAAFIKGQMGRDSVHSIDRQTVRDKAVEMMALIDDTIERVRHIASDLRPGILDDLGLVAALEWYAETFQTRTGVPCEVVSDALHVPLDRNAMTSLFRIAQEALTNVTRHAQATQVYVTLIEEDDGLTLVVQDNGKGINKNDEFASKSLGLLGIEERARLLDGTALVTSEAGRGTTVTVKIPMDARCFSSQEA